jgi:uroporphyrin-III C-methyltransferase
MAGRSLAAATAALVAAGRDPGEPAALVEAASLPQQRTVEGTLSSIAARAEAENVGSPALLVLGEVVGLRARIARGLAAPFSEELPAQAAAAQPRSS